MVGPALHWIPVGGENGRWGGGAGGGRGSVRRRSYGVGGVSESASHDREPRPAGWLCGALGAAVDSPPPRGLTPNLRTSCRVHQNARRKCVTLQVREIPSRVTLPPPPAETPPSPDRNRGVPAPPPPLFFGASPRRAVSGKPPVSQTPSLDARGTGRPTRPSLAALGGGGHVFKNRCCVPSSFKMAAVHDQDGGDG